MASRVPRACAHLDAFLTGGRAEPSGTRRQPRRKQASLPAQLPAEGPVEKTPAPSGKRRKRYSSPQKAKLPGPPLPRCVKALSSQTLHSVFKGTNHPPGTGTQPGFTRVILKGGPSPAAPASPWNLLEMQISVLTPGLKIRSPRVRPSHLQCSRPSR